MREAIAEYGAREARLPDEERERRLAVLRELVPAVRLMLIHLDTSVLVSAFTGPRRSLAHVVSATQAGHVLTFCAVVQYEWLRGPRTQTQETLVRRFFGDDAVVALGSSEVQTAAALYRRVKHARQRQADLAIAACALEHNARFWTLHEADFADVPELVLYQPPMV